MTQINKVLPICHVLIIEDDPFVALHLTLLVEDAGASSVEVYDTEADAVMAADVKRPDVIFSDVQLFEGTGPQAVARIRDNHGSIPVIFVTGTPEDCALCDYARAILVKPVIDRVLVETFISVVP